MKLIKLFGILEEQDESLRISYNNILGMDDYTAQAAKIVLAIANIKSMRDELYKKVGYNINDAIPLTESRLEVLTDESKAVSSISYLDKVLIELSKFKDKEYVSQYSIIIDGTKNKRVDLSKKFFSQLNAAIKNIKTAISLLTQVSA